MLRCPHCGGPLEPVERVLRCPRGHSFDIARQGYVALERAPARGDTPEMVAARADFLAAGHFAPIAEAIVAAAEGNAPWAGAARLAGAGGPPRTIVDVGAGPGYYLASLLEADPDARGFALDSSRPALRRAARAHPRITAVACDIWDGLPLADAVADVLLNVFAPRNPGEMRRVLAPDGRIVVVTPTERHLRELELLRVHPDKRARLVADLGEPTTERLVEFVLELDDVTPLVAMGPSAHHDLRRHGPQRVTASVTVATFTG